MVDPPALNHYKQLMKRPSSERPIDSVEEDRDHLKMFLTVNNPSTDINADSIASQMNDVERRSIGTTQLLTNNYTHEAMLLSQG